MKKWGRILHQPVAPLGRDGRILTGSAEHIALSRKAASEGMVLLKNEGGLLPLSPNTTVALFGIAQFDYVKGGGGSGDVYCRYIRNIYDGLEIKENEGKIRLFKPLSSFYRSEYERLKKENPKLSVGGFDDVDIPEELVREASLKADVAIVNISRFSAEERDRCPERGDFYLSENEERMVKTVTESFDRVVVLLNVGGMVDTEWFIHNDAIPAALLTWQGGQEAGLAVADILVGDENPSGKLTDTFARSFADYPFAESFNESRDFVNYTEDIYVGYRYFETVPGMKERVNYPFGFGLSYTEFQITNIVGAEKDGKIRVTADVTNIGRRAGKEVVQLYYSAPQGRLGKSATELCAFQKTRLLSCGETQMVCLEFDVRDMASYDDAGRVAMSAYVLEKGEYTFRLGSSVRDTQKLEFSYSVDEDRVVEQLTRRCAPKDIKERLRADGSLEPLTVYETEVHTSPEAEFVTTDKKGMLIDVAEGRLTLDEFMSQLSVEQLIDMCSESPNLGVCVIGGFGGCRELGIPSIPTADGPAGLRVFADQTGVYTTAFPCATQMACSWNEELMYEVARAGATEVKENNLAVWLTPGMNIHRNPLCGRNFEYFSEDPLVTGKAAAAVIKGIQSMNIAATVKHFACNNKEINRMESDSRVSERALREIYLKGFEIAVKEAAPYCLMSSYNKLNGVRTGENYELLTGILREEWSYDGLVTTDWEAHSKLHNEVRAGNNVKMWGGNKAETLQAYRDGRLTRTELYNSAKKVIELALKLD